VPRSDRPVLAGCICDHSQPLEWKYGLIGDHPIRFALASLQMIVGWSAFLVLTRRLKRYR
jgi:hypothetical protein